MRSLEEINKLITEAQSTDADYESIIRPLLDERNTLIKQNRDKWDDENYFVLIDCPVHTTHKVKLFTYGHRYAGIWECDETGEGISDVCAHYDIEPEVTEDYEGAPAEIYVCKLCGVAVQHDEDEPDNE